MKIGDPVEVARPVVSNGRLKHEWVPGTICAVSEDEIGVAFADHTRKAYSRWGDDYVLKRPSDFARSIRPDPRGRLWAVGHGGE